MIDHKLLKQAREAVDTESISKEAFNAMTPEAQAAAAQQGAAPPPPGAPPPMDPAMAGMDPAMMGGAPPPMDPAMMGGAPPMDPAMMDPAMAGMDPAMMDPAMMDPAMMGADPVATGTPVTLNLEDLQIVLKELDGGESPDEEGKPKRATNRQIMDELSGLREMVSALAAAAGVQLPAGDVGAGVGTEPSVESANPEDLAAVAQDLSGEMGEDPMSQAMAMGLPPGEMPPDAMPKMAFDKWSQTQAAKLAEKTN